MAADVADSESVVLLAFADSAPMLTLVSSKRTNLRDCFDSLDFDSYLLAFVRFESLHCSPLIG